MKNYLLFIVLLLNVKIYSQQKGDSIQVKGIMAVEVCRQSEFNPCFNFSPTGKTKNPMLYKIGKDGNPDFTVAYAIPFPTSDILEFDNADKLYDAVFDQHPITDSLDVCLSKKQVKRIRRFLKKEVNDVEKNYRKEKRGTVKYTFDGCITYYLYQVDLICIYHDVLPVNRVNEDGEKLVFEEDAKVYYIKKVNAITPVNSD
ncbi:hypothetical protein [Flavobacterium sp. C4GT6]|uniref:hypothetical protein n=1 Tax=Flavobacterium sp. C4GT6 TaxID=3103818 RepID=UPI002ED5ADF3